MSARPPRRHPRPRARRASVQRGGVLLALVLALAGGGALWLASRAPAPSVGIDRTRSRLLEARRALLAHSGAYPESYGPRGAGPGHLPCPDTDTPLSASTAAPRPNASPFRGDGPNPPCGGAAVAVGRLPRQVSLPSRRELFHRESAQRFVYAVSADAVNNPPGRIVAALGAAGDGPHGAPSALPAGSSAPVRSPADDPVVALIVDTGGVPLPSLERHAAGTTSGDPGDLLTAIRDDVVRGAGERAGRTIEHVTLRRGELLEAAGRRVAAWFVATLRRPAGGAACESYTANALLAWLADAPPREPPPADVDADADADTGARIDAGAETGAAPTGVPGVEDAACDRSTASRPDALERTPTERHWFVRDGWYRLVTLRVDPSCREEGEACRVERVPDAGARLAFRFVAAAPAAPTAPGSGSADPRRDP